MKRLFICIIFIMLITSILFSTVYGNSYGNVPVDIQAKLFLKILAFNNDVNKGGEVTVHVINSHEFAAEINKSVGTKIGKSELVTVNDAQELPSQKPSVIYIGDTAIFDEIIKYTRSNNVLSLTGIPDLVKKGATLGVGVSDGKPKVLLNISSSKKEGISWNPVILKISKIYK
ncbi:MAG: YfiR family protein [Desulfobacterales bacterium]|nr:YfiR family protein [Desulfobacterales bacterium]